MKARSLFVFLFLGITLLAVAGNDLGEAAAGAQQGTEVTAEEALQALAHGRLVSTGSRGDAAETAAEGADSLLREPQESSTPAGLSGAIAFSSNRGGAVHDLYTKNAGGGTASLFVNSSGHDATPVWSPDGSQLVFASDRSGNFEIYLRTANGVETAFNFSQNSAEDVAPNWHHHHCDEATASQPLLLVHGWGGPDDIDADESGFAQLRAELEGGGYRLGCNLFYATGVSSNNSREENGMAIQANLRAAYDVMVHHYPQWRGHFNIVGHSYGGLNARFYLESPLYLADNDYGRYGIKVNNLFTLGSPHGGVILRSETYPGAILIAKDHLNPLNWTDFLSAAALHHSMMDKYNRTHQQPGVVAGSPVCYRVIGGDFLQQSNVPSAVRILYNLWRNSPGDIGVSLRSSLWHESETLRSSYPNTVATTTVDMHGYFGSTDVPIFGKLDFSDLHSYVKPNSVDPVSTYLQLIYPHLGDSIEQCAPARAGRDVRPGTEPRVLETAPPTEQRMGSIRLRTGTMASGEVVTGSIPLDWSEPTAFYLSWSGGSAPELVLVDPPGNVVTPAVAEGNPNIDYGELQLGSTGLATYVITNTLSGTWTYTITAGTADTGPVALDYFVMADSPLVMQVEAPEWLAAGASAAISVRLFDQGVPVTAAAVEATITHPDGSSGTLILRDDGVRPDSIAKDGVYRGAYGDTVTGGYYFVFAEARGTLNNQSYYRNSRTLFSAANGKATLSGSYTDYPEDVNGDGFYEYLVVQVRVNVKQPGKFSVAAHLQSGDGETISLATSTFTSDSGDQTVSLRFPGEAISASGIDGPYSVSEVLLIDDDQLLTLDEGDRVWVTAAYDHRRFGRGNQLYLPFIRRN